MLLEFRLNAKNLVVIHVCTFMSMCWETFPVPGMTPEGATSY